MQGMKIRDFEEVHAMEIRDRLARFCSWWIMRTGEDPENFPRTMSKEEWEDQFTTWYEMTEGK